MTSKKITLNLAFVETGNVLWKHIKMGRIRGDDAAKRGRSPEKTHTSKVYESKDFLIEAIESAVKYDITVYDALFLILARRLNDKLFTTDRKP